MEVYQDNLRLHKARPAQAAAGLHNVSFFDSGITDSPDMNCTANLFSAADTHLCELEGEKPAGSAEETNRRFGAFCRGLRPAYVQGLVRSMPQRAADLVAARGGPTRW